jgi:hypothetical protein
MLSYTYLLRISFVDAVDEKDANVDAVVYNMFAIFCPCDLKQKYSILEI